MRKLGSRFSRNFILLSFALLCLSGIANRAIAAPGAQEVPAGQDRGLANIEAQITKEVRHELVMLPFFSVFDNLEYRVEGGKVTLIGQVVRPDLKDDAGNAVKHIEGVNSVDNQIEVLPTSPMDDQIRRAEFHAIYSYPSLQLYVVRNVSPIHIIVNNGHVTLEGAVATQADKDTANVVANSVPNVFSVTNHLQVDGGK
jgi:hyperosmotically inducible periplasmic protein